MARSVITVSIVALLTLPLSAWAQPATYKGFNRYSGLVEGVDFYAAKKSLVEPYGKPVAEAVERMKHLLGDALPKGCIFICSTLEQKDAIYEPMILKLGYEWTLPVESPEIQAEEMMARMKSMMGDDMPAEFLEQFKSRAPSMAAAAESRMVQETVRRVAYAVIQTSFAENLRYRSSRLNDMAKSPLPDWLDIGIGVYVAGEDPYRSYLLQNMDKTFSIEDILTMSRPFVASTFLQNGSSGGGGGSFGSRGGGSRGDGQGFPPGGFGGMSPGGAPPAGFGNGQGFPPGGFGGMGPGGAPPAGFGNGQGFPPGGFGGMGPGGAPPAGSDGGPQGRPQRTLPKDEQDQMLFDGQSSTFFAFMLEKLGMEKVRELIRAVNDKVEGRDFLARSDMLGEDYGQTEQAWIDWVQAQPPEPAPPDFAPSQAKERI